MGIVSVIDEMVSSSRVHAWAYTTAGEHGRPAKGVAIVACMDARINVESMFGLPTGDAHIIRNAGGIVTDDVLPDLPAPLGNARDPALAPHRLRSDAPQRFSVGPAARARGGRQAPVHAGRLHGPGRRPAAQSGINPILPVSRCPQLGASICLRRLRGQPARSGLTRRSGLPPAAAVTHAAS